MATANSGSVGRGKAFAHRTRGLTPAAGQDPALMSSAGTSEIRRDAARENETLPPTNS